MTIVTAGNGQHSAEAAYSRVARLVGALFARARTLVWIHSANISVDSNVDADFPVSGDVFHNRTRHHGR